MALSSKVNVELEGNPLLQREGRRQSTKNTSYGNSVIAENFKICLSQT